MWDILISTYGAGVVNALPPWMTADIASAYLYEMIDVQGDSDAAATNALETIRNAPQYREMYDAVFPGNRRDDGSLRLTEGQYTSRVQSYKDAMLAVAPTMAVDVFENEYADLIAGDVLPEEFQRRVSSMQSRVIDNAPAIRDYYAQNFGLNMTDEGILASMLSPRVNDALLSKQLTMAEVGGEAAMRNFDLTQAFVESLVTEGGLDRGEANRLFGTAERVLPALQSLARRHGDADDTFDIYEFAQGGAGLDVAEEARMERLMAQEQAVFTGGAQAEVTRSRNLGLTGLAES
jgi:hypothetical protein